jgi:hypothetical protein
MQLFTNKTEGQKLNQPTFARVKYLVITQLTTATPFAQVSAMRHQMSCCRFPSFSAGSLVAFSEPEEPSSSCVASYQPPNAVLVEFHTYKDSVMRAAGMLLVPTMCSRDILHQAKGDHLDLRSDGSQYDQAEEAGPVEL